MALTKPKQVLERFSLTDSVFLLGSYERGVTVLSQQLRALNLAWAMVETLDRERLEDVAVVGGGFAGLTVAAGLIRKGLPRVTLFEKRPVLCPLQQGNDTRWLHPHIYDWPAQASEAPSAALPLLNWNAGRASDVVAQVLASWEALKDEAKTRVELKELLNTKYLRVDKRGSIEWVAEDSSSQQKAQGQKKTFTAVILALGFGEEKAAADDSTVSYWRNESMSQTELGPARKVYLVSGFGDGALLDLFRLRIAHFRPDRILAELFKNQRELRERLRDYKERVDRGRASLDHTYDAFDKIAKYNQADFEGVLQLLQARLRHDTSVVLHVDRARAPSFMDVFAHKSSFQNKFLLYCLFKLGAFIPTQRAESDAIAEYGVGENVVRRHGTEPNSAIQEVLTNAFFAATKQRRGAIKRRGQPDSIRWIGGYWDQRSDKLDGGVDDTIKRQWRQEYLPSATALLAGSFASAVASVLDGETEGADFRVVLHRVIRTGAERSLQQACEYQGRTSRVGAPGRTFRDQGIIGLAFRQRRVCRTRAGTSKTFVRDLQRDMNELNLGQDAQKMSSSVMSLLALPVLAGGRVIMVVYADSLSRGVFSDSAVRKVLEVTRGFCGYLESIRLQDAQNFPQAITADRRRRREPRLRLVEVLSDVAFPPPVTALESLNFEFTSFYT